MVGSSLNCRAEMSADISTIPSWKAALLERKRVHDKDANVSHSVHTPTVGGLSNEVGAENDGVPGWKRDILARKQNQKNSSVFLAKHAQTGDKQSDDMMSAMNNGHAIYEPEVVDINISDATEDQPIEERLLPVHQNPIFCLDLKKRHQSAPTSGSSSTRSSLSPRVAGSSTTTSRGSHVHSSGMSSVSSTHAPITPDAVQEEVFSNENDTETEVAYGKGFVHKLLMKFSHLSGSGADQTPNNRYSKLRRGSLGDVLSGSASRRQTFRDFESLHSASPCSTGMPTTKFHSADDLLHETNFHSRIDRSDSSEELDVTTKNEINGELSAHADTNAIEDGSISNSNSGAEEITNDLPFANIVSTARSLFESLAVHSASQKHAVSSSSVNHPPSSHFLYVGTLERSHKPKNTVVTETIVHEVSPPKRSDYSYGSLHQLAKRATEGLLSNGTALIPYGVEAQRNLDTRIESEVSKPVQESSSRMTNGSADAASSIPTSSHSHDSVHVRNTGNISANKPLSHSVPTLADPGISEKSVSVASSHVKELEHETVPVVSMIQSKPTADDKHLTAAKSSMIENTPTATVASKTIHTDTSVLPSQPNDNKENIKTQPASSVKKPAPSRPGKLSIRPASNLVAAKTSTEYLELTKYNDIRKGEFAPPLKRERMEADMCDDEGDRTDGGVGDSLSAEEYIFTGGGVVVGRSLLTKTNRNKSLQILFNDSLTVTHEYPSEQSLMAATPPQPGDLDYDDHIIADRRDMIADHEDHSVVHSTGLLVTPSIIAAGALSSYQSRTQVEYQLGMHMREERKPNVNPRVSSTQTAAPPVSETTTSWSKNASSDLLF